MSDCLCHYDYVINLCPAGGSTCSFNWQTFLSPSKESLKSRVDMKKTCLMKEYSHQNDCNCVT